MSEILVCNCIFFILLGGMASWYLLVANKYGSLPLPRNRRLASAKLAQSCLPRAVTWSSGSFGGGRLFETRPRFTK
ncbi:hypothetical protein B0J14DRAFT_587352 [Halenospora varia]|nr:hypothetical protein B0J14DRAFT_587352 [Halenospora varia]